MPDIPHFKEPKLPESKPETEFHEDGSITQTWVNSDRTTTVVKFNKDGALTQYYTTTIGGSSIKSSITINYNPDGSLKEVYTNSFYNKDRSNSFTITTFEEGKMSSHFEGNSKTGITNYQYCYKEDKQYYYKTTIGLDGEISTKSNIPYTNYSVGLSAIFGVQVGVMRDAAEKNHFYIGLGFSVSPVPFSASITYGKGAEMGVYGTVQAADPSFNAGSRSRDINKKTSTEHGVGVPSVSAYLTFVF